MPRDFTLIVYRQLLLEFRKKNYSFYTFEQWCDGVAHGKYIILRHDVDNNANRSLKTAQIENELGIKASYYFRVVRQSNYPEIITQIAELGHEIGYHYEDLSICNGNLEKAILHFEDQLKYFRSFYPIRTISMHGSPISKFNNLEIWEKCNYHDFGIVGESYIDFINNPEVKAYYLTDSGRRWDGVKYVIRDKQIVDKEGLDMLTFKSTFDIICWLNQSNNQLPILINTHPQRWNNNLLFWSYEYLTQNIKNFVKQFFVK